MSTDSSQYAFVLSYTTFAPTEIDRTIITMLLIKCFENITRKYKDY